MATNSICEMAACANRGNPSPVLPQCLYKDYWSNPSMPDDPQVAQQGFGRNCPLRRQVEAVPPGVPPPTQIP